MRLALTVEGGFKQAEGGFAAALEPAVARILADFPGAEMLILPTAGIAGAMGTATLLAIETDAAGAGIARFAAGHPLGAATELADHLRGPFPLQLIGDAEYAAIVAAAQSQVFTQSDTTPASGMTEVSVAFRHTEYSEVPPVKAVLETLRREAGNLCALTGAPLPPGAIPTAIRWHGADRLHVNNLLLLSPAAEEAFRNGDFTIRDDFSIIVDIGRIDPELLEMINPNGRLRVSGNPALRPAPKNLAWHRRHIFRLG